MISSAAHSSICTISGTTGEISQIATASKATPKKRLTASIQPPARGSKAPAERPISNSGMPMPMASENSDTPPSTTSLVWLMYSKAPAKGAATQGPTINAEMAPMTKTLVKRPPWMRLLASVKRLCRKLGICNSKKPNMDSDSATKIAAPAPSAQGFCSALEISVPERPAATPAIA